MIYTFTTGSCRGQIELSHLVFAFGEGLFATLVTLFAPLGGLFASSANLFATFGILFALVAIYVLLDTWDSHISQKNSSTNHGF